MVQEGIRVDRFNEDVTMKIIIKVSKQFKIRLWVGSMLIKIAAFIFGCRIDIENSSEEFADR